MLFVETAGCDISRMTKALQWDAIRRKQQSAAPEAE
jgi:hypothetical protein